MSVLRQPPKNLLLRRVLVDELCELDCVRDPSQRVLFGQSVGEYLERHVDLPGKDARNDTVALVQAVLREQHDAEAGLDALLYAVGLHEGSDIAGRVRERVLSAWAPEPGPALALLGAFEDKDVNAARALLAPHAGIDRGRLLDRLAHELRLDLPRHLTPDQLFEHLLDLNAQADGLPPAVLLLEFVAELTPRESERRRLREWCEKWSAGAGAQEALLRRRESTRTEGLPDADLPRCLIVMVDPAGDGSPDIFVRHWVNRTSGYWAPVSGNMERATLETLGGAVERAIRRGEEFWAEADSSGEDLSPIHVEFVLPYSMLNHDVAGLGKDGKYGKETDASDPVPIGLRYYVHLRSLERMRTRDPAQLRRWRLRWQTLKAAAAARPHPWTASDPAAGLRIWRNRLVVDQQLTAVTLGAPAVEGQALEALKAAIAEGIGVALWDRRVPSEQQFGAPLNMLVGYPRAQLPVTIHRLRMKAETDADGQQLPGRHVAFFYDDPFRLIDCEEVPA
ncbi:hypothetical protein MTF65_22655 [Streptomyces sp. APSN-46.1]|uniref:VMAP-C domain-containing protein n=1 Tax=Streptomyces sp. APSN-46.1 TaxID=2929049 RepID=UPI001FB2CD32|nr:hypothetical protein [Streptomyces sp. APSN-46.1]MCJ1680089.1 hypothetical protein [Streptomyces sp. APSN-46.1]